MLRHPSRNRPIVTIGQLLIMLFIVSIWFFGTLIICVVYLRSPSNSFNGNDTYNQADTIQIHSNNGPVSYENHYDEHYHYYYGPPAKMATLAYAEMTNTYLGTLTDDEKRNFLSSLNVTDVDCHSLI